MKLRISCMQCFQDSGKPSEEMLPVEMRDDGLYKVTCSNGHTTITAIQEQKFEVLFDLGAMALLDGYPREATSSISASLERFYEFYIKVISLKYGVSIDEFANTWKNVSAQSERQFGAFLFSYLLEHKTALAPVINNVKPDVEGKAKKNTLTWTEFRNAVIHKGYIPSVEEVLSYGDVVYNYIYKLIDDLKSNNRDFIQKATFHHLQRAHQTPDGGPVSTMSIPTLLSLARGDQAPKTFREALEDLKKYKAWLYH